LCSPSHSSFCNCFHWALRLRVDYVEQTTQFSRLDLWRLAILAALLLAADVMFVWYALANVLETGVGVVVLFGFESTLLACAVIQSSLRLVYNVYDMKTDYHWRAKGFFVLWTDFVAECFNVLVYLLFFGVVLIYVGRPLHLIRQMYHTFRRFLDFVHDISLWRRATVNFDDRYPNVTQAELLEQNSRRRVHHLSRTDRCRQAPAVRPRAARRVLCRTGCVASKSARLAASLCFAKRFAITSKLWKPPRDRARAAAAAGGWRCSCWRQLPARVSTARSLMATITKWMMTTTTRACTAPLQRNHQDGRGRQ
jgi:hypothetical protein